MFSPYLKASEWEKEQHKDVKHENMREKLLLHADYSVKRNLDSNSVMKSGMKDL